MSRGVCVSASFSLHGNFNARVLHIGDVGLETEKISKKRTSKLQYKVYGGVCLHVSGGGDEQVLGHCLVIRDHGDGMYYWELQEMRHTVDSGPLTEMTTKGMTNKNVWNTLKLISNDTNIFDNVNGVDVGRVTMSKNSTKIGRAALISGWHVADFDEFSIRPTM